MSRAGSRYLYVLPGFLIYAAFALVPFGHTFWISFHEWDGITPSTWVGLDNYRRVFTDPQVRETFGHALVLVGFYALLPLILGLVPRGPALADPRPRDRRLPRGPLPPAGRRARRGRGGVALDPRPGRAAQRGPSGDRPREPRAPLARGLHVGAAVRRPRRHVGHLRARDGAPRRRRPEDPDEPVRRRPGRRRRALARVLRRHAARACGTRSSSSSSSRPRPRCGASTSST